MEFLPQTKVQETDAQLLSAWAGRRDENAFRLLTERYAGLVYHVAHRRLGRHDLSQDVVQLTFAALARKAAQRSLAENLAAWLQRVAYFESMTLWRKEAARRRREINHAQMNETSPPRSNWHEDALPEMDAALLALNAADRQLLMDRFFAGRAHRDIGAALGLSENAVQKRISILLEKLGGLLRRRGVVLGTTVLAGVLTAQLAKAAPPGICTLAHQARSLAPAASWWLTIQSAWRGFSSTQGAVAGLAAGTLLTVAGSVIWSQGRSPQEGPSPAAVVSLSTPKAISGKNQDTLLAIRIPGAAGEHENASDLLARLQLWLANPGGYRNNLSAQNIVHQLPLETLPTALDLLMQGWRQYGTYQNAVVSALFIRWADLDQAEAGRVAVSSPLLDRPAARRDACTGVIESLAARGLSGSDQAVAFAKSCPPANAPMMMQSALVHLSHHDPSKAWELALAEKDLNSQHQLLTIVASEGSRKDPASFSAKVLALEPGAYQARMLESVYTQWIQQDASAALAHLRSLGAEWAPLETSLIAFYSSIDPAGGVKLVEHARDPRAASKAVSGMLGFFPAREVSALIDQLPAAYQDEASHAAMANLIAQGADLPGVATHFIGKRGGNDEEIVRLMSSWCRKDIMQASQWVKQLAGGRQRDLAASSLVRQLVTGQPENGPPDLPSALEWMESIQSPNILKETVQALLDKVPEAEKSALQAWAETHIQP